MSIWLKVAHVLALSVFALLLTSCCGQFFKGERDLLGITVAPNGNTIKIGATQQFSATGAFQFATGDVTARTTWQSSDPEIATIDESGVATGLAFGTTTIKGTCECYSKKVTLTVGNESISLSSIAISPSDKTITAGNTQQFTATATYSNSTNADISSSVTWTSSDSGVATVSSSGVATAIAAGTTTITASSGGISATTTLTVIRSPGL